MQRLGEHDTAPNNVPAEGTGHTFGCMVESITEPPPRKHKKRRNKEKDMSPQEEGKDDAMDISRCDLL